MELNDYQAQAMTTALPSALNLDYMVLGLASEAGEVAGKRKKEIRDGNTDSQALAHEAADCLWYVAGIAQVLGVSLEHLAQANLDKLASRKERGKISGSGDHR